MHEVVCCPLMYHLAERDLPVFAVYSRARQVRWIQRLEKGKAFGAQSGKLLGQKLRHLLIPALCLGVRIEVDQVLPNKKRPDTHRKNKLLGINQVAQAI